MDIDGEWHTLIIFDRVRHDRLVVELEASVGLMRSWAREMMILLDASVVGWMRRKVLEHPCSIGEDGRGWEDGREGAELEQLFVLDGNGGFVWGGTVLGVVERGGG